MVKIINIASNIALIIICIFNYIFWKSDRKFNIDKKKQDIKYQNQSFLYQELVLKKIDKFFDHISNTKKLLIKVLDEIPTRERLEIAIDALDYLDSSVENEIIAFQIYSKRFHEKICESNEVFYSSMTNLLTKIPHWEKEKIRGECEKNINNFILTFSKALAEYAPSR